MGLSFQNFSKDLSSRFTKGSVSINALILFYACIILNTGIEVNNRELITGGLNYLPQ